MKNKGFTLIELLAVIVILAILAILGTTAVVSIIHSSNENANKMAMKNLEDAAITYGLEKLFLADKCALNYVVDDSNYSRVAMPSGCDKKMVTVKYLIDNGYFTDNKNSCDKNKQVFIYKYHYVTHDNLTNENKDIYDTKAYLPKNICRD